MLEPVSQTSFIELSRDGVHHNEHVSYLVNAFTVSAITQEQPEQIKYGRTAVTKLYGSGINSDQCLSDESAQNLDGKLTAARHRPLPKIKNIEILTTPGNIGYLKTNCISCVFPKKDGSSKIIDRYGNEFTSTDKFSDVRLQLLELAII